MLRPQDDPSKRREKTRRHFFSPLERFYELCDGLDEPTWREERAQLERAADAERCLDRNYPRYHACAEEGFHRPVETCKHAKYPERRIFLGAYGLIVVVEQLPPKPRLVTAFRPAWIRDERSFVQSGRRYFDSRKRDLRTAVRRTHRRASL